jgi:glyoxylase-like metal-dependent hydrolase (beta-lactamase superfamily II)
MDLKTLAVGPLETNCHIVWDEASKLAMVIDPGDEPDRIMDYAEGLEIKYIVLTHAHFDHAGAVPEIKQATGAAIALHPGDMEAYRSVSEQAAFWGFQSDPMPEPDIMLDEGDKLALGALSFKVLHTPGHSPGCICLLGEGVLFSGDTLFKGSVGRTDLPGGDMEQLKASFRRLLELPPETRVLPGHGPASTISEESRFNVFSGMI